MIRLHRCLGRLHSDRRGVTVMEYAMIAAATIVAIAGIFSEFSGNMASLFNTISSSLP